MSLVALDLGSELTVRSWSCLSLRQDPELPRNLGLIRKIFEIAQYT